MFFISANPTRARAIPSGTFCSRCTASTRLVTIAARSFLSMGGVLVLWISVGGWANLSLFRRHSVARSAYCVRLGSVSVSLTLSSPRHHSVAALRALVRADGAGEKCHRKLKGKNIPMPQQTLHIRIAEAVTSCYSDITMKKGIAMRFIVLTADMLSQFYYQNGVVFRKSTARPTAIHKNKQGYGRTKVDSRYVYMKRLVWALHHLRLATPSQNAAYRRHKKGYWYCNKSQKWKVAIQ